GGTLTNQKVVLTRIKYMKKLQAQDADGSLDNLPKKEVAGLRRDMVKLQTTLGGIAYLTKLPDAMVVVDVAREHIAVAEAHRLGIPVVAIVDSNCNPDLVDYVVPGNDDALRSIKVLMDTMAASIEDGLHEIKREEAPADAPDKDEAPAEAAAEEK
ncbi:MAG: 30S ribosomal protein S2, partial [Victivallales bacterium]|nr:30S ribosomal protein S2 [Victivallales bacterium]